MAVQLSKGQISKARTADRLVVHARSSLLIVLLRLSMALQNQGIP